MLEFELICCVVNCGHGSKTLGIAKLHGVRGGTICIGTGTIKNKLLEFFDLTDIRKEIVIMIAEKEIALRALDSLNKEMAFHKPNHGIGFSFSLNNFIGTKNCEYHDIEETKVVDETMFNAIFTVVEKGLAEDVIDAATNVGARGGTIINARGSGINETSTLFAMPIEPEKEMVMILANNDITESITAAIRDRLHIDEAGHGIIFVVPLNEVYGLY